MIGVWWGLEIHWLLSFLATFRTVFWWIYGRGDLDALDSPDEYYETGQVAKDTGNVIAAVYHIAIILVLFNLLIAMMARSFEKTLVSCLPLKLIPEFCI